MIYKKLIKYSFVFLAFIFVASIFADAAAPQQNPLNPNAGVNPYSAFPQDANFATPNPAFNYANGFLNLSGTYSELFGYIIDAKLTHKVGQRNACALEVDYGQDEKRVNGTWGFAVTPFQLVKVTAERLSQNLPFDFASGNINKTIPQYAYGGAYEYIFPHSRINDANFSLYYANAQSENLNPIDFTNSSGTYIDYRHIAGATSEGGAIGLDVLPWRTGAIGAKLNYDEVKYSPYYNLVNTTQNNPGVGGTLNIIQLITQNLKLTAAGSMRQPYDDYQGGLSWLMPIPSANQVELGLLAERVVSHNSTPNDTRFTVNLALSMPSNPDQPYNHTYGIASFAQSNDLSGWTADPAVHMDMVLATADELVQQLNLVLNTLSPASGPIAGNTLITLMGSGFTPGVTVTFDGITATAVHYISQNIINAVTPPARTATGGEVEVKIINPNGQTALLPFGFTYLSLNKPIATITSLFPNVGALAGGTTVTIKGSGLSGVKNITFGGQLATQIKIANDNELTAVTPAHNAGVVDVMLNGLAPGATAKLAQGFTYKKLIPGDPPQIIKSFSPNSVVINTEPSTLTLIIQNPDRDVQANGVAVTDNFPAGMQVAPTPNFSSTGCGGGAIFTGTTAGSTSLALSNGSIAMNGGTCSISIDVIGTSIGTKVNTTSAVTSTTGTGSGATANLDVTNISAPTISKAFGAAAIPLNGTTTLTLTLQNNAASPLTNLGVTDNFPAGLEVATTPGVVNNCGGTVTATAGAGSLTLNDNGNLNANASCTITVNVTGTTAGSKNNTTSVVRSAEVTGTTTGSAAVEVVAPPTITKAFGAAAIKVGTDTTLTLTITNPDQINAATGVAVTDNFHTSGAPGIDVAASPNIINTCGGTVSVLADNAGISLTGGTIAAKEMCSITLNVTGAAVGSQLNTTGPVSSAEGGTGSTASAPIEVTTLAPPTVSKSFGAASVPLGGSTTLTLILTNQESSTGLIEVGIIDNFPAGLVVAATPGVTNGCGGTVTASPGANSISLNQDGILAPSASCTITLNVTGATPGHKVNTTDVVTSNEINGVTTGTDSLDVIPPLTITKTFGASSIAVGDNTTLVLTISNPDENNNASGVAVTDTFAPGAPGLQVASTPGVVNTCGGTVTAAPNTGIVSLSGGSVPAKAACTITVNVTGTATGTQNNQTDNVSSTNGGTGNTASASINITSSPMPPSPSQASSSSSGGNNNYYVYPAAIGGVALATGIGYGIFHKTTPPDLVEVAPQGGPIKGGTTVTLKGTGFKGVKQVRFGELESRGFKIVDDNKIITVAPSHSIGVVAVSVSNHAGATTLKDAFTYGPAVPNQISPYSSELKGGIKVMLKGSNFTHAQGVNFGGTAASFSVVSDNEIIATVPAAKTAGPVSIIVTNPSGAVTLSGFTYVDKHAPIKAKHAKKTAKKTAKKNPSHAKHPTKKNSY